VRYLFKRKGSENWYVRLQRPGQKTVEKSLGTSDLKAAEIAAADLIKEHKVLMYGRRVARLPRVTDAWIPEYAPGMHDGFFATERELRDLTTAAVIGPNGGPAAILAPAPADGIPSFAAYDAAKARQARAVKNGDDEMFEQYLKHSGCPEKAARDVWHTFKTAVGKPLAKCTRNDGRAVVAALGDHKSTTLRRKMVPLIAMANFAIAEGALTFNPFAGCVKLCGDAVRRLPFDDDDMRLIRDHLHELDTSNQLLVRVLASSGMRRGEAFEISGEAVENGVRYSVIGTKTEASRRRVPFPADLLPYLPAKITAPLFRGSKEAATLRIGRWLRKIGIKDKAKVLHSFRHRAQDRLRAAGVPEDLRWAILGHEKRTIASGYGKGFPVPMLKESIDKIGF
jgi:integrase